MKIRDFKYERRDGKVKDYSLMLINESETHMYGFDLKKLSEYEARQLKAIQEDYESKLKAFMRAYRSFIKENIKED